MQYEVKPLTEEDEAYIGKMIGEYAYQMAPPEPGTPEEESGIVFKAEDENGAVARVPRVAMYSSFARTRILTRFPTACSTRHPERRFSCISRVSS